MTLAVAHGSKDGRAVLDAVRERKPPFSPEDVVAEFAALLRSHRVQKVTSDRYADEWPRERFRVHGVEYAVAEKPKSDLYRDLLPLLNGERVSLLDHPRLVAQLCGLERRTARSGKDSIDHGRLQHDDIANAVAGALVLAAAVKPPMIITWDMVARSTPRRGPAARCRHGAASRCHFDQFSRRVPTERKEKHPLDRAMRQQKINAICIGVLSARSTLCRAQGPRPSPHTPGVHQPRVTLQNLENRRDCS
jgi:hypothetical protein